MWRALYEYFGPTSVSAELRLRAELTYPVCGHKIFLDLYSLNLVDSKKGLFLEWQTR